jgi:hypothetical protein
MMENNVQYLKLTEEERIVKAKLKEIMGRKATLKADREPVKPIWYKCGICFHFDACEQKKQLHRGYVTDPACITFEQLGKTWQHYPSSVPIDRSHLLSSGIRVCPICFMEGHRFQGESNGRYTDCKVTFEQLVDGRWTTVGQCGCFAHQHGVREH